MLSVPNILNFSIPDAAGPGRSHRMTCYEWGNPQAKNTVLCVHALTRNARDFDFLARALASDYRVLCPDVLGRGKSEWLKDSTGYNYPNYVAQISALIMQLGLTRIDWVGTSMGGIIGMMMVSALPGLIDKLVINDIGCIVSAAGMKRILSYAPLPSCPTRAEAEAAIRERYSGFGIRDEALWQHMFTYGLQEKDGCVRATYDPAVLGEYSKDRTKIDAIADLNLWGLWPAIAKIPVLLIRGMESDLLTHETAVAMQEKHPNLTLQEIPAAGHAPALMDDAQTGLIRDWLKSKVAT